MAYQDIFVEREEHILTITLNRPRTLNSLTRVTVTEVAQALEEARRDNDVRVVIITGAGRGFCSGTDVRRLAAGARGETVEEEDPVAKLHPIGRNGMMAMALQNVDKPTIAAVNGVAVGAGLSLAVGCDIRIASEDARFGSLFIKRAIIADTGATYYLPRVVGMSKALELALTGDLVDAEEAYRIGMVSRIVPSSELMDTARDLASRIAANPPIAVQLTRRAILRSLEEDLPQALESEHLFNRFPQPKDRQEGAMAFIEKREPRFVGG